MVFFIAQLDIFSPVLSFGSLPGQTLKMSRVFLDGIPKFLKIHRENGGTENPWDGILKKSEPIYTLYIYSIYGVVISPSKGLLEGGLFSQGHHFPYDSYSADHGIWGENKKIPKSSKIIYHSHNKRF